MQRWYDLAEVPAGPTRSVVTIGNFDGVHRGHQRVLTTLVALARDRAAQAVAITFDPHPIAVLYPERAPQQIDGLATRLERLELTGLDAVLVMRFTHELAAWSPRRFVHDVLVETLRATAVVVGRDTRFGHRNSGDIGTLRELGAELGFEVFAVEDFAGDGTGAAGGRWSSTWIRGLLADGDVRTAATALGHLHRVVGSVVHGDHRGRALGFPTANLAAAGQTDPDVATVVPTQGLVPADGIYAGWLTVLDSARDGGPPRGVRMPAAVSVGTNPTFDGHVRRVEAYVLDRDDLDLYGLTVAVDFVERLRPTERFEDVDKLVAQMHRDVEQSRAVLGLDAP